MIRNTSPLRNLKVAAPCSADWNGMVGNDRVRFCSQCSLYVYNLSGMSKRDAETIVQQAEGRLCARFYKRADGTILTQNCPVGLKALKRRLSKTATAVVSAALSFITGLGVHNLFIDNNSNNGNVVMGQMAPVVQPIQNNPIQNNQIQNNPVENNPVENNDDWIQGAVAVEPDHEVIMGKIALPDPSEQLNEQPVKNEIEKAEKNR
jgi:hypothetical protein